MIVYNVVHDKVTIGNPVVEVGNMSQCHTNLIKL
jgi:hypothetical protein